MTKKFPKEMLQALLWGDDCNAITLVSDQFTGTSRWSSHHQLVFRDNSDGQLYIADYTVGLTEHQDEAPFEYDEDMIECWPAEAVERVVTKYEVIK